LTGWKIALIVLARFSLWISSGKALALQSRHEALASHFQCKGT
jgi:hypothetical protein